MDPILFTLYVAGQTPRSQQAIANLDRLCDEHLDGRSRVEVIDVTVQPDVAESERILTTPTLIKTAPGPVRRITGDLSDGARVLAALALGDPPAPTLESR